MIADGILSAAVFAPDLDTALMAALVSAVILVTGAGAAILGTLAVVDFFAGDDAARRRVALSTGRQA
jgi:hypothetical protein